MAASRRFAIGLTLIALATSTMPTAGFAQAIAGTFAMTPNFRMSHWPWAGNSMRRRIIVRIVRPGYYAYPGYTTYGTAGYQVIVQRRIHISWHNQTQVIVRRVVYRPPFQ